MQENQNPGADQQLENSPKAEKAAKSPKAPKAPKELKPEKAAVKKSGQSQFEVELEKVQFSEKGKKLSKPNKQFMSVNAFIHFLKNGKFMGWSLKILNKASDLNESQIKALNQAAEEWNAAQTIDPDTKERENQISKF